MAKRHYSSKDIADALAVYDSCGGVLEAAARQSGVPRNTLRGWVKDRESVVPVEIRQESTATLAETWRRIAELSSRLVQRTLEHLDAEGGPLDPPTLKAASTIAGIATDKHLLLTGGATERQEITFTYDDGTAAD